MRIKVIKAQKQPHLRAIFSYKVKSIFGVNKISQKFDGIEGYKMAAVGGLYGIYNRLR